MPGVAGGPVVTTLVCLLPILHARLWVQRAPGIPHALCFLGRKIHAQLGRIAPRDGVSFRGDAKHRTRNLEIPGLVLTHHPGMTKSGINSFRTAMTALVSWLFEIESGVSWWPAWLTARHRETENISGLAAQSLKFEAYSIDRAFKECEQRDDGSTFVFRP